MEGFKFTLDTTDLQRLRAAFRMYPQETQKAAARLLGDMAWELRQAIPKVIDSRYTIRDKKIMEAKAPFFFSTRPKAGTPIGEQEATAGTTRIESGSAGLFTGWEEEIYGLPREMRAKGGRSHRQVWSNAREGNSVYGLMLGQYRLRTQSDRIPDSADYGLPIPQFLAMVAKSDASGRSKRAKHFKGKSYALGKNRVFIMDGGARHPRGLYAFVNGKVKAMQKFNEQPVKSAVGVFDWRSEAEGEVRKKFTPEYILAHYIAPALEALWKK